MTVTTTSRTAGPFLGTGSVNVYPFAFKVFLTTDVLVQLVTATGVLSTGSLGADYAVSLNADQNASPGGIIILTNPLASGASLTIGSQVPLTQGVVLTTPGNFYPTIVSDALDKLTILIQQALSSISGAIRVPEIASSAQILPSAAQRANLLLGFDSNGNPITVAPTTGTATALATLLATSAGSNQLGFIQNGTGAVARFVQAELRESIKITQFGAVGNNAALDTAALMFALASATNDQEVLVPPSPSGQPYLINQPITLGGSAGARLRGMGKPTLTFSGIGSTTDCITLDGGGTKRQVVLSDLILNLATGQDGVAILSSNRPIVRNLLINTPARDGFALKSGTGQWIEKGVFDSVTVQSPGRHGFTFALSGADGAFINKNTFINPEVRGPAKITAGGTAIYFTSTASSGASQFEHNIFVNGQFDAQYTPGSGVPVPSLSPILTDSGSVVFTSLIGCTFENSNGQSYSNGGVLWNVTGSGAVSGLTIPDSITNSGWGNAGLSGSITKVNYNNISFGTQQLQGVVTLPASSRFRAYTTAATANVTGDGTLFFLNATAYTENYDPNSDFAAASGIFTAPVAGQYEFAVGLSLTNLTSGHTTASVGFRVASGGSGGNYTTASFQGGANRDAGNNIYLNGSDTVTLAAGDTVYAFCAVAGSTKTVGINGAFTNGSTFKGKLVG